MLKGCWKLIKIQMLQLFGLNEIWHSKDKKKKWKAVLLFFCFFIVGCSLMLYVGMMAYSLKMIQMTELIPSYMMTMTSAVILFFTIFKAGAMLFNTKDYEMLAALPVSSKAIVVRSFFTMYVNNIVLTALVLFPSTFVYVNFTRVGLLFYLYLVLSIFLIPLLPMTVACIFGALLTALTSRMKYKNLITIVSSMGLCIGIMAVSFGSGDMNQTDLSNMSMFLTKELERIYPLSTLFSKAVTQESIGAFLAFAGLSVTIFAGFVCLTAWKYMDINSALKSHTTKNNYTMTEVKTRTLSQALYAKERKRYFSSSVYVLNTGFGYVFMLIMGIFVFILGPEKLETTLNMPGAAEMIAKFAPLMIGGMACISPPSVASVSLEGKQWEGLLALPITTKNIVDSKIKWTLTLSIPSGLITSALCGVSLKGSLFSLLLLFVVPQIYGLFAAIGGIYINLKLPNFAWENEAVVVKQSAATMLFMLIGFASVLIPIGLFFLLEKVRGEMILLAFSVVLLFASWILYKSVLKTDLRKL
ncbi:MAG: hypothetical protein RR906_02520 [Acetivibrio sp.]